MIPDFITYPGCPWPLLPPGIHDATMEEVYDRFVINGHRKLLYNGLKLGLDGLFASGCIQAYLDGSYVTAKDLPNDYDVCYDALHMTPALLDPVFFDFSKGRAAQKAKYQGEYFPNVPEASSGKTFLDFFQIDRDTGKPKGIIRIINYLS